MAFEIAELYVTITAQTAPFNAAMAGVKKASLQTQEQIDAAAASASSASNQMAGPVAANTLRARTAIGLLGAAMGVSGRQTILLGAAFDLLGGKGNLLRKDSIDKLKASFKAALKAMASIGPVGWVIGGALAVLTGGFALLYSEMKKSEEAMKDLHEASKSFSDVMGRIKEFRTGKIISPLVTEAKELTKALEDETEKQNKLIEKRQPGFWGKAVTAIPVIGTVVGATYYGPLLRDIEETKKKQEGITKGIEKQIEAAKALAKTHQGVLDIFVAQADAALESSVTLSREQLESAEYLRTLEAGWLAAAAAAKGTYDTTGNRVFWEMEMDALGKARAAREQIGNIQKEAAEEAAKATKAAEDAAEKERKKLQNVTDTIDDLNIGLRLARGEITETAAALLRMKIPPEFAEEWKRISDIMAETDMAKAAAAAAEKIKSFADGVKESLKTPIERFKEFREELMKAFEAGLITGPQLELALGKKMKELLSGIETKAKVEMKMSFSGLEEGWKRIQESAGEKEKGVADDQLAEAIKTNTVLNYIFKGIEKLETEVTY